MRPGAPPPGTLHKRPRPASDYQRRLEWARQPTGGWKVEDFAMTPSGRLCRVVTVAESSLELRYMHEAGGARHMDVDVTLQLRLCRWLSAREVKSLKQPDAGHGKEAGNAAA